MLRISVLLCLALICLSPLPTWADGKQAEDAAIFAGGCFWCMEPPFDELDGVISTTSGFSGGHVSNPSYEQVVAGRTGHLEVVKVTFDPTVVDFEALLAVFWKNIDPLDDGGQFCDRGDHYRSAIFFQDDAQRQAAEVSKQALEQSGRFDQTIVTRILAGAPFYPAEAYHQNYYQNNPIRYRYYRARCGRDARLRTLWGEN